VKAELLPLRGRRSMQANFVRTPSSTSPVAL
jgi:hypothetical protein